MESEVGEGELNYSASYKLNQLGFGYVKPLLSWPAGAGHCDREGEDVPGARPCGEPFKVGDVVVGQVPLGGADEQGPPVRVAEHQRERRSVLLEFDPLQDFTSLGYPDHGKSARLDPDRAFGVHGDAVRCEPFGEHPSAGQAAVGLDVERGELACKRLSDDQRPAVRVLTMPLGNWMSPATWRSWPPGVTSLM
jgi:hypothetical protein